MPSLAAGLWTSLVKLRRVCRTRTQKDRTAGNLGHAAQSLTPLHTLGRYNQLRLLTSSMAYQVLARKYRPQLFSDVIGQDHVTRTLLNALTQKRIAHGYIFSGHRGIGKTTIARILAAALNCSTPVGSPERPTEEPCRVCVNCREISSASRQENSIFEESHSFDVEEIDAATNRGIDDARLLTSKIQTRPTNKSKYKIIILDEAHQITDAAWNALLKTLEEPPDWAIFMFATTQPEDIPQTIRSRCQHFSFHAVKLDDIVGQLRSIATKEALDVDDATLTLLAEAGDGSMRDALSIMDQAIASAPVVNGQPHLEITQVRELMGSVSNVVYEQILEAVHANNSADVLAIVGRLLDAGNGAPQLARQFVRYLRNSIVAKVTNLSPDADATGIAADLLQISPEERHRAARSAALFTEEDLSRFLAIMLRTFDELGYRQEQRFHLELGVLKLVHVQRLVPIEDLLSQLGAKPDTRPNTTPSARTLSAPSSVTASPSHNVGASVTAQRTAPTPPPSPFESDRTRKVPTASINVQPEPIRSEPTPTAGSMALAPAPVAATPVAETQSGPQLVVPAITVPEVATEPSPAADLDLESLQAALVAALAAVKGQQSASEQIEDATLKLSGNTLEIHTTLSKTMLPVVVNTDAERILKAALREANAGSLTLKLVPGVPAAAAAPKKARAAVSGSAAELAEKHPMVQEARRLFSAEISNVIDLRDK
jgi:DNA polymerase-3 subunit gamma/tau